MGQEELYYYQDLDFFSNPSVGSLSNLPLFHPGRLYMYIMYNVPSLLMPWAYLSIYRFRKNDMPNVVSENVRIVRRKINIVSTSYNMAVWLAELLCTALVSSPYLM